MQTIVTPDGYLQVEKTPQGGTFTFLLPSSVITLRLELEAVEELQEKLDAEFPRGNKK